MSELTVEEKYGKMTQHQHILALPDTYIGSVTNDLKEMYVYDDESKKIIRKDITFPNGLYKIFDEILVNANDHSVRDTSCKNIHVTVNKATGLIEVFNDGSGIEVEIHKEHNVYVPEMIFSQLLTSANYNVKNKIVGGKNGYGAKLCNIYSTEFIIETADAKNKKHYLQTFTDNMYTINPPTIKSITNKIKPFTKISFRPDFEKFGLTGLTDDIISLFKKRVYDIAVCTLKSNVQVKYNNEPINILSFNDYINLYYDKLPSELIYQEFNERWRVGVIFDKNAGGLKHVSFVNGICTYQGGTHVNYVVDQICKHVSEYLIEKKKLKVKSSYISQNLSVFVESVIEDPSFLSQTKDMLSTKVSEFGSKCEISEDFMKRLFKTGLIEEILSFAEYKEKGQLTQTDFKKTINVKSIEKLEDAEWAGKSKRQQCRLILTEGDSAKTFAIDGLDVIGREKYGVFPLRGKFLNVREASVSQLMKNAEFRNLKLILGLKQNKKYTDVKSLRYGGIIILTDQDVDGSHIKGLIINMFDHFWPSLLKIKGFVQCINTPIVKTFKNNDTKRLNPNTFYTLKDYKNWSETVDTSKYTVKYYKGLGTSGTKEAKEIFGEIDKRIVKYFWENNVNNINQDLIEEESSIEEIEEDLISQNNNNEVNQDDDDESDDMDDDVEDELSPSRISLKLAFERALSNQRKNWLFNYHDDEILDTMQQEIPYSDFIHKELKHYSANSNKRMISKSQDGLKPSQRKILYATFKRNLGKMQEIKVAQLGGYVAGETEYHHGEVSLYSTIINMAQTFTGSNNINLLYPSGQFGSRREGGKDAASPRYTFTRLECLTPLIFRPDDDPLLTYVDEDGILVEPEFYVPILPTALLNGVEGIGTGFSTYIPPFNPLDLVNNLKRLMNDDEMLDMKPWFRGFSGQIEMLKDGKVKTRGSYEIVDDKTVRITELPIGVWTDDYKTWLNTLVVAAKDPTAKQFLAEPPLIRGGNNKINIIITFYSNNLQQLIKTGKLEEKLKLTSSLSMNNMYLWSSKGRITKYVTVEDIIFEFYNVRYQYYERRKAYYIRVMENELKIIKEKRRFIELVVGKKLVISNRDEKDIDADLVKNNFQQMSYDVDSKDKSYAYIKNMRLWSLSQNQINELTIECEKKQKEFDIYVNKTIKQLWTNELDEFVEKYNEWLKEMNDDDVDESGDKKKKLVKGRGKKVSASK
jgi:DNA topoisomerase-2